MLFLLLRLAPLAACLQGPQGVPAPWVELPLPSLSRPAAAQPTPWVPWNGRHLQVDLGAYAARPDAVGPPALAPEALRRLCEELVRDRGLELEVAAQAPPLLVRGKAADVATLAAEIELLEAAGSAASVPLRMLLRAGPDASQLSPIVEDTVLTHPGQRLQCGRPESHAFLASYAVEVASDAGVAEPRIGSAQVGPRVVLEAARLASGGVYVRGLLDVAEILSQQTFEPEVPEFGALELPEVGFAQVLFAGVIDAENPALSITIEGLEGSYGAWELELRTAVEPARTDPGFLDLAAVSAAPLPREAVQAGYGLAATPERRVDRRAPQIPALGAAIELESNPTGSSRQTTLELPWALVAPGASTQWQAAGQGLRAALERQHERGYRLQLSSGPVRVNAPGTERDPLRIVIGRETLILAGYSVQIAPETWMPEPRVESLTDALVLEGLSDPSGLRIDFWQSSSPALRVLSSEAVGLGKLQLPQRTFVRGSAQWRHGSTDSRTLEGLGGAHSLSVTWAAE